MNLHYLSGFFGLSISVFTGVIGIFSPVGLSKVSWVKPFILRSVIPAIDLTIMLSFPVSSYFSLLVFYHAVLIPSLQTIWVNHSFDIQVWCKDFDWDLLWLWPGELANWSWPRLWPWWSCYIWRQTGARRSHPTHHQWLRISGWVLVLQISSKEPWTESSCY